MAYRIFWTPIAVQDLRDICDFISRDNLVAAQRMGEGLIKQSEAMATFPLSGRMGST
jgi:plasmid stabilization system protein ParE